MSAGERALAAARAAVGSRFRLHGREPASGLDCVGLVAIAVAAGAGRKSAVPSGYPLRGGRVEAVIAMLDAALVRVVQARPGDVVLFAAGPGQLHLAIKSAGGVIHADAGLRRVVERPGEPPWRRLGAWRIGEA